MRRVCLVLVLLLLAASPAAAQTLVGDRVRLNTGPCVESSGSGTPEGAVTGNICDTFHRTDTGQTYHKISGTASTTLWISWGSAWVASRKMAIARSSRPSRSAACATIR